MAKQAFLQRELKRAKLAAKFAQKYADLKTAAKNAKLSDEERDVARLALQKLPRNANPTRQRNRCEITGRPRGTFVNSVWHVPKCVKWLLLVRFPALPKQAGKP